MTPAQLWLYGMANYLGEGEPPEEDMSSFGIDYDGPLPSNEYDGDTWNDFSVQVPEIPCMLSNIERSVQLILQRNLLVMELTFISNHWKLWMNSLHLLP